MEDVTFRRFLATAIFGVWAAALIIGVVTHDYLGAQIASPVMIFVAGYYFGSEVVSRIRGVRSDNDREDRWSHMP